MDDGLIKEFVLRLPNGSIVKPNGTGADIYRGSDRIGYVVETQEYGKSYLSGVVDGNPIDMEFQDN